MKIFAADRLNTPFNLYWIDNKEQAAGIYIHGDKYMNIFAKDQLEWDCIENFPTDLRSRRP